MQSDFSHVHYTNRKLYSEEDIREALAAAARRIAENAVLRLNDDGFFDPLALRLKGTQNGDGSFSVEDALPLWNFMLEHLSLALAEFRAAIVTDLFDESGLAGDFGSNTIPAKGEFEGKDI